MESELQTLDSKEEINLEKLSQSVKKTLGAPRMETHYLNRSGTKLNYQQLWPKHLKKPEKRASIIKELETIR